MLSKVKLKAFVKAFTFTSLVLIFLLSIIIVDSNTKKTAGYIKTGVTINFSDNEISLDIKNDNYILASAKEILNDSLEIKKVAIELKNMVGILNYYFRY
ncbi:MAG: hypothetical protein RR436_05365 [Clostridia bacterium]